MYDAILNIGLRIDREDGPVEITVPAVLKAMRALNISFGRYETHVSNSEPTLSIVAGGADHLIHMLAEAFDQDCIAVYDLYHAEGRMIGPRPDKWGAFDPSQFILPNGSYLSEARSAA
jgi:hypothetical protein